jgi:hypothetical protein
MWLMPADCLAQADAFDQFMQNIGRLFDVPALTPEALEMSAGLQFTLEERSERFMPTHTRSSSYLLVQSFPGISNNGSRLVLQSLGTPVDKEWQTLRLSIAGPAWPTCVAEPDLHKRFGPPVERLVPTRSAHARGFSGMPRALVSYRTRYGAKLTFEYINECANSINISSSDSK